MYKNQQDLYLKNKAKFDERQRQTETLKNKENRRNYPIENTLQKRVIGQLGPIYALSSAIRRKENGWHDEDRPLVFMFCGPSGVGKTELAKALAEYTHDKLEEGFIRIDMTEYQQSHEVSKLIGSPPGYIGHGEGGQLTERLKKCPDAVVLLDEVEKAHPDILTIMLQLFDEGRITDGKGTTVICKGAIFIMTSNLAQHEIANEADFLRHYKFSDTSDTSVYSDYDGDDDDDFPEEAQFTSSVTVIKSEAKNDKDMEKRKAEQQMSLSRQFLERTIYPLLYDHFRRDEFLGRINDVLIFLPFSEEELREITSRELSRWAEKARTRHGITMTWEPEVVDVLADGYNVRYGARSIKYEVERKVINPLAKANENDEIRNDGIVNFAVGESKDEETVSI
ncbi:P-loop containing nucleoside triphosphate hydrolase protein [Thamnidium elegans]|nr:P-loop containing nucleoside triphosphate hydrolase protein [Thamnidium elegans]